MSNTANEVVAISTYRPPYGIYVEFWLHDGSHRVGCVGSVSNMPPYGQGRCSTVLVAGVENVNEVYALGQVKAWRELNTQDAALELERKFMKKED